MREKEFLKTIVLCMAIPKDIIRDNPTSDNWCILSGWRGSIAHNMFVPQADPHGIDDRDVIAVFVPPMEYYLGLEKFGVGKGTVEIKRDEWDIVAYEVRKFVSLLAQGNPNVLSLLWLQENHYLKGSNSGWLLVENRHLFVGRHVYRSFVGYAYAQLSKAEKFDKFGGYMGEKRKALVDKYGYDCKNMAHCIRLLRMGIEFLRDGQLYVIRHDAPQLLEIKTGKWTLEQVKAEADRLFRLSEATYLTSTLPVEPDHKAISKLVYDIVWQSAER